MIAQSACFDCLQRQIHSLCSLLQIHDNTHITQKICTILESAKSQSLMPPQIAIDAYKSFRQSTNLDDPFYEIKQESITQAHTIVQNLLRTCPPPFSQDSQNIESMHDINADSTSAYLDWAVRMAILGNVIDYGSQHSFDFKSANFDFKNLVFAHYDIQAFQEKLTHSHTLLYLADNAGENIFDEILLRALKTLYPHLHIYYAVRGEPIINDLTLKDLFHPLAQNIQKYCTLLDSGVRSPGFVYEDSNAQTQTIYNNADVILAKGMGNFECLHTQNDERLFLLFKVKCDVVAACCGAPKGEMMFIHCKKGVVC